jgi:DNA-binding MarR family transcriptional regulator
MLVVGLGLGMVMQVLVIAVQNAGEYHDLGVATSGATLFRLIGGSVGTAVLGAIFAVRLTSALERLLPPGAGGTARPGSAITTEMLAALSPAVRAAYSQAFTAAMSTVFVVAAVVALVGFALTWLLPERPLRTTLAVQTAHGSAKLGEAFAMPVSADSLAELRRGLAALANREERARYMDRIVREADVELSPLAAWLLVRLEQDPGVEPAALARAHALDGAQVNAAADDLAARGLIARIAESRNGRRAFGVTPAGCEVLGRIVAVRRRHVAAAAAEWGAQRADGGERVRALQRELVPDVHASPELDGAR